MAISFAGCSAEVEICPVGCTGNFQVDLKPVVC